MRFQVPQFIEVEDKIFGPFTIKQFIFLAGGAGISFMVYVIIGNLIISLIPIILIMGASGALAMIKINKRPLITVVESAVKYFLGAKLYIWKKEEPKPKTEDEIIAKEAKSYASVMVPKISNSRLKDLTWSLDIKESIYSNKNQK